VTLVTIKPLSASVAPVGAVLPGVVCPWENSSGAGVHSALPQNFSSVVFVSTNADFVAPRGTRGMAWPLAVMASGLPVDIRKQYVHKTRVNVGGDGASGPHPEWEPA
jgi:hypothetical protein